MELKDVKFETIGEAAKSYPQSTLVIRKQFFDGVVARFQDTIRTRTEMLVEEQKIRVGLAENLQKEYHKTFDLQEEIRKQKYRRCLARSAIANNIASHFQYLYYSAQRESLENAYNEQMEIHFKFEKLWKQLAEKYKQPINPIEKDLETL